MGKNFFRKLRMALWIDFKSAGSRDSVKTNVAFTVAPDTYYNIKAIYDGSTIRVFVDGILEATITNPVSVPNGKARFRVKWTTGKAVRGNLSDIAVY